MKILKSPKSRMQEAMDLANRVFRKDGGDMGKDYSLLFSLENAENILYVEEDGKIEIWGDEFISYATLIQIVRQFKNELSEIEIEESFNFKFRGYHLDITKGGVPNLNTFKSLLRWLFLLKYNYFGIYLEDLPFAWENTARDAFHNRLHEQPKHSSQADTLHKFLEPYDDNSDAHLVHIAVRREVETASDGLFHCRHLAFHCLPVHTEVRRQVNGQDQPEGLKEMGI